MMSTSSSSRLLEIKRHLRMTERSRKLSLSPSSMGVMSHTLTNRYSPNNIQLRGRARERRIKCNRGSNKHCFKIFNKKQKMACMMTIRIESLALNLRMVTTHTNFQ